jgi:hypothetical protein
MVGRSEKTENQTHATGPKIKYKNEKYIKAITSVHMYSLSPSKGTSHLDNSRIKVLKTNHKNEDCQNMEQE